MQQHDYIIIGGGASGLMLAYQMAEDSYFKDKKVLLIDKEVKNQNDRTWCFWEQQEGIWDAIVIKRWKQLFFGSPDFSDQISMTPYDYKCIRSKDFYEFVHSFLSTTSNITCVQESVTQLTDEGAIVVVGTDRNTYLATKVFNSALMDATYRYQKKYPVLQQHFVGWFIKTPTPLFDAQTVTFMDFRIDQKEHTRFMYIVPFSETEALFEYTLFSEDLLEKKQYETAIARYLENKGIVAYQIIEKEQGTIPMTCYEFRKQNTKNILHIGTAGGWTKPSTGFTFRNSVKKVARLVDFLKKENDFTKFDTRTKYWYYDLLLLDVLHKENQHGAILFARLFRKNSIHTILKFLDEETSFIEDLQIMKAMPAAKFIKMILQRIVTRR